MSCAYPCKGPSTRISPPSPRRPEASAAGAKAFTRGTEVHFAPGQYDPASSAGLDLLGHELTHVIQQANGRVPATATLGKGMSVNTDPSFEAEADQRGAAAARHTRATIGRTGVADVALAGC